MSSNAGNGKAVCVTGASGYIASWLVKLLLLRGYTVRATVRDPNDPKKVDHLLKLEGAKERLQLFKADLLEESSFDSAVEGCEGVFHTASPCNFNVNDPQIELIDPAVKGTLNVLKSCAKSTSLKRVILTSSMAAVLYSGKPIAPDVVVDETWFSKEEFCKASELWTSYELSKTLAEDAAWKFVRENNIDMVVINPGVVLGPLLQPSLNQTSAIILTLLNGAQMLSNACVGWIHVKDVVNAHIQAFEISSASGRYCLAESVAHFSDIVKITHELFPALPLTEKLVEGEPLVPQFQVSKEKAMTLGIEFIPLDVSVKETVESLKEKKFLNL
ncbi:tetraketide alpha-pyrone reductase 1-like [Neltuma alba]|uniref:tetraketide alpha-pyrone reductase 1-like n=1 Tax=Neltuma alba TaxID=207710 RepID=UPI0010A4FAE1|nr:tetraketide alpha-pyrone reductase 1-like [Prosopis alba]